MPAYEMQWVEPEKNQEEQEQLRKRLEQEIDACTEVRKHERNKLKQFLEKRKIYTISEMDYLLRKDYEGYLRQQFSRTACSKYLTAYDRVKQHWIQEKMKTLAGQQECQWRLENGILFIPYHPNHEIAKKFDFVRNRSDMIWDFRRGCAQILKKQIFKILNVILEQEVITQRHYKVSLLQYLYDFCAINKVADIEKIDINDMLAYKEYLDKVVDSDSKKSKHI